MNSIKKLHLSNLKYISLHSIRFIKYSHWKPGYNTFTYVDNNRVERKVFGLSLFRHGIGIAIIRVKHIIINGNKIVSTYYHI